MRTQLTYGCESKYLRAMVYGAIRYVYTLATFCIVIIVILATYINAATELPDIIVATSILVDPELYTADGGKYDLYLQTYPKRNLVRLTRQEASSKLKIGGAIREPMFSGDGQRILFQADYVDADERRTTMTGASPYPYTFLNVWLLDVSNGNIQPMTKGDLGWHEISWSPDRKRFSAVYASKAGVIDQDKPIPDDIYVFDIGKSKTQKLLRVQEQVVSLFWSHDSSDILYQLWRNTGDQDPNLYAISRTGGKPRVLIKGASDRSRYSFSPDGKRVAFVQDGSVYAANADGKTPCKVVTPSFTGSKSRWTRPQWSTDSGKLAVAEVLSEKKGYGHETRLHTYSLSEQTDKIVTTVKENVAEIRWSKDGKWLLLKIVRSGQTETPDRETGWYTYNREGLIAVALDTGQVITLKEPNEETKGLDWVEVDSHQAK